jgi:Pilin (bacterial filament)
VASTAQRGGRIGSVLMIDFDLEAPGLHRYFHDQLAEGRLLPQQGVMEVYEGFDSKTPASTPTDDIEAERRADEALSRFDLRAAITELAGLPGLFLMPAGKFDASYSSRVNRFDWENLYTRSPLLPQKFAELLSAHFDYVLVDSRTGVTDTGGICTKLIPDTLVVAFTPNRQSLTGIIELIQEATRFRKRSDDLRPLAIFPLPSRIEVSEPARGRLWRHDSAIGYQPKFEDVFRNTYGLSECRLEEYFSDVAVPHLAPYAYGEEVATLIESNSPSIALKAYEALATRLRTARNPWETPEQVDQATFQRSVAKSSELEEELSASKRTQSEAERRARRLGWAAASLVVLGVATALVSVPAYRDYSSRAHASEGLAQTAVFKVVIAEWAAINEGCAPLNQREFEEALGGSTPELVSPVRSYTIGEYGAGSVSINFDDSDARLSSGKIILVPEMGNGYLSWRCSSAGLVPSVVPKSCNDALSVYQEPEECISRRALADGTTVLAGTLKQTLAAAGFSEYQAQVASFDLDEKTKGGAEWNFTATLMKLRNPRLLKDVRPSELGPLETTFQLGPDAAPFANSQFILSPEQQGKGTSWICLVPKEEVLPLCKALGFAQAAVVRSASSK